MNAKRTILIVDDDPKVRKTLSDILRVRGYAPIAAATGKAALDRVEEEMPAVALIDLRLEDISGLEVMGGIKERSPATECIVLTGYATQASAIEAVNLGAYSYVQKPYDVEQLLVTVRRAIEKREAVETLRESEDRYRGLFEGVPVGLYRTAPEGEILDANPALVQMLGYSDRESLLAVNVADTFVDLEERTRWQAIMGRDGVVRNFEMQVRRCDGTVIWVQDTSQAVWDADGRVLYYEEGLEDITDRKRAEEELQRTLEKLREALGGIIQTVASTVETKDPYTAGHQRGVANLARAIATEMGLSQEQIEGIRMAGSIHDIGKIAIPAEVLSTPIRLNDFQWGMIKTHPKVGYDILKKIEFPWPVAQIVLQHHERLDGSGYPQGLLGEEILLEARILAVADVVEAMASHRPYRPARGLDKALEEILQNRGVLYDAEAVGACLKLFTEKGFEFE